MSTESNVLEELVSRAAEGNEAAQSELFSRYWPLITRVARVRQLRLGVELDQWEEADDVAQRVAMEILRSLPKQEWRGRQAFIAWMKRLADRVVIDTWRYHRAQMRDRRAETHADDKPIAQKRGRSAESMIELDRRLTELAQWLEAIKPEYAAAIRLHYMGYTHQEVGDTLGCTAEAARKLVARGEAKLVRLRTEAQPAAT